MVPSFLTRSMLQLPGVATRQAQLAALWLQMHTAAIQCLVVDHIFWEAGNVPMVIATARGGRSSNRYDSTLKASHPRSKAWSEMDGRTRSCPVSVSTAWNVDVWLAFAEAASATEAALSCPSVLFHSLFSTSAHSGSLHSGPVCHAIVY